MRSVEFLATLFAASTKVREGGCSTKLEMLPMATTTVEKVKYESLVDWLRSKNGVVSDKVFFQDSTLGGGYGAFVSEEVDEGDIIFTVPREACVTLEDATNDPKCGKTFQELTEKAGPGANTVVMAAYLAKEYLISTEHDVNFGPYLQTLPWERGINGQEHIIFWTDDEVDASLIDTFCYKEATDLRSEVSLASTIIEKIVGDSVRIARGEMEDNTGIKWPWQVTPSKAMDPVEGLDLAVRGAFVSLLTRSFQDSEEAEKLVPMLDMLQHSEEANIRHSTNEEDGTVEVRARRKISAGEELLNQYRSEEDENMPYHRFFTRFGFIPGIMEPIENLLTDKSSILFPKIVEV